MIRPAHFGGNPLTCATNHFQGVDTEQLPARAQAIALMEFDGLVHALRAAGVTVHVFEDTPEPHKPDAVFPNNWVSFHADGSAVLYPMLAPNRRRERRLDLLEALSAQQGFHVTRILDLTIHEHNDKFLEGTGSLVLDRVHRLAYACISPRTDLDVLGDFAQQLDYDVVAFEACDANGAAIYHTNVLMSIGTSFAAICSECIREDERPAVLAALRTTGHAVLDLTLEQMHEFAGNMLELKSTSDERVVAMSTRAFASLLPAQRALLEQHCQRIVTAPIPTIERLGGGSVRCMIAEVFLPKRQVTT